jgi:glycosyltransferase involved in cell wall biosynthesis
MKIAMADECGLKFCSALKKHWEDAGHEVRFESGASEFLAPWADIYYVEWWTNNIHYLFNWYQEHPEAKKPKFIVRAIDWDIWSINICDQRIVDFVDHIVMIAPYLMDKVKKNLDGATGKPIDFGNKLTLIRPGLELDKFPLKPYRMRQLSIGMVCGDMWELKNGIGGYQIFAMLAAMNPAYQFHVRGQYVGGEYNRLFHEHFVESRKLNLTLYPSMIDMNSFYEKIDVLVVPSLKEAFSYATAEAMACGIKPVINNFIGASDIWPKKFIFNDYDMAVEMIKLPYTPDDAKGYRKYISDTHNMNTMLSEFDALLGT